MSSIPVQINDQGELTLPPEALEVLRGKAVRLTVEGSSVRLEAQNPEPLQVKKFQRFLEQFADPQAPVLPLESLRRERLYDE